jgi:predicted AAA+ superfamily ATPase
MKRIALSFLNSWLKNPDRKPLVIRGTRQVGKTWLVRQLAHEHNLNLIELNFEKRTGLPSLFTSNEPKDILIKISSLLSSKPIDPSNSLLFFDEIQAYPELLAKLRWFAEDMPDLPVIAAGSLLEFVLDDHTFSMPVGRINYMYLEPLSFEEFLLANNQTGLVNYMKSYKLSASIPAAIHEKLMELFKEFIIIGGMPAAVHSWTTKQSLHDVHSIHNDLLTSYRDDFSRYGGRMNKDILDDVMQAIPKKLGEKFVYSKVNPSVQGVTIKKALELLSKARVCTKVKGTIANGVPLGAEIQDKYLKVILVDVGLCSTSLGLSLDQLSAITEVDLINSGGIAEQVTGQLLRTLNPFYIEPALYYWQRESGGSAEIDYVIQHQSYIIPIEVKAGSTGGLKSLHVFMALKKLSVAVRINSDLPSKTPVSVKDHEGKLVQYELLSLPFYLLGELHRLLSSIARN